MTETSHRLDSAETTETRASQAGATPLRAAAEAAEAAATPSGVETGQYLTFRLAGERFGLPILRVREILEFSPLTPVPLTPVWIRGVLNLRGNVVPVIDLALKFDREETPVTRRTCIVIVEVEGDDSTTVLGVMVDCVDEVVTLDAENLEPAPEFGTSVRVDYLRGLGKIEDALILLLEADRVLSTDELLAATEGIERQTASGEAE